MTGKRMQEIIRQRFEESTQVAAKTLGHLGDRIAQAAGVIIAAYKSGGGVFLFGNGDITKSTLLFIKLKDGVDPTAAARKLKMFGLDVAQIEQFRFMLEKQFGIMFVYVDAVNIVALVIAFLFIMITLYTMVLQRTRDIAILKSSGASNAFLVRQVLAESLLLSLGGTLTGIGLSVPASWAIEHFWPLLTVQTSWRWIIAASIAAVIGAFVSGLYPAWRATRVDMVEAMSYE